MNLDESYISTSDEDYAAIIQTKKNVIAALDADDADV